MDKITSCATDLANLAYNTSTKETNRQLANLHRTNQQMLAGTIFSWLNFYATECSVDDRNRKSIEFSRKLLKIYQNATGEEKFPTRFPLI